MSSRAQDSLRSHADDAHAGKAFAVLGVYAVWVLLTWLLEKRVGLFMRFDPPGRTLYALAANVVVGTAIASFFVGPSVKWRSRPLVALLTAALGALAIAKMAPPAARDAVVLVNAFAQVLPTSIAEVVVCWLLVGGAVREASKRAAGETIATVLAIVVADLVFAVYHLAHSAPFDQPAMMAFLMLPGLVVGLLVFVVRDRTAAIVAQNFLAMIGITKSIDADAFRHPFAWAYAVAAVATIAAVYALRASDRRLVSERR